MSRIKINVIIIIIGVFSTIGFFLVENETILLPISTILILVTLLTEFLNNAIKIKSGVYLKAGKNSGEKWTVIMFFGIGLFLIIVGIFRTNTNLYWKGIDSNMCIGVLFIFTFLFRSDNFQLLIKRKSVYFNRYMDKAEWKLSHIDKIVFNDNNIIFTKGNKQKEILIENDQEFIKARKFLSDNFSEKIIKVT